MIRSLKVYAVLAVLTALVLVLGAAAANAGADRHAKSPCQPWRNPRQRLCRRPIRQALEAAQPRKPTEAPAEEACRGHRRPRLLPKQPPTTETRHPPRAAEAAGTEALPRKLPPRPPRPRFCRGSCRRPRLPRNRLRVSPLKHRCGGVVVVESPPLLTDETSDGPLRSSPQRSFIAWFAQTGRRAGTARGRSASSPSPMPDKTCHDMPTGEFRDWPWQLSGRPTALMIAFTGNPVQLGNGSDVWFHGGRWFLPEPDRRQRHRFLGGGQADA